jgi:serine protease Do
MRRKVAITALFCALSYGQAWSYEFPKNPSPLKSSDLEALKRVSDSVSQISSNAKGALAFISVSKTVSSGGSMEGDLYEFFFGVPRGGRGAPPRERKQEGLGSGFLVDLDKGYVVTNNHVIEEADEINIKLANGRTYKGNVVGRDKNTDIAIVKIKDSIHKKNELKALSFSKDPVKVGDFVIALGAPFGLEASASFGVVSATGRGNLSNLTAIGNFIQTDAAINPGNSGGPLLNLKGEVIGVNTAIFSRSGGYNGIGFAVPSEIVMTVGKKLIEDGKVLRGYIGVSLQELAADIAEQLKYPEDKPGVVVAEVERDGPAAKAGLKGGDVISQINGQVVATPDEVSYKIGLSAPGTTVEMTYYRDGKENKIRVKLGEFPDQEKVASKPETSNDLGVALSTLDSETRDRYHIKSPQGVLITEVRPGSKAESAGLEAGDVIFEVNRRPIKTREEFTQAVKGQKRVLLAVERRGRNFFASLDLR